MMRTCKLIICHKLSYKCRIIWLIMKIKLTNLKVNLIYMVGVLISKLISWGKWRKVWRTWRTRRTNKWWAQRGNRMHRCWRIPIRLKPMAVLKVQIALFKQIQLKMKVKVQILRKTKAFETKTAPTQVPKPTRKNLKLYHFQITLNNRKEKVKIRSFINIKRKQFKKWRLLLVQLTFLGSSKQLLPKRKSLKFFQIKIKK